MSEGDFKNWLLQQSDWAEGKKLPDGFVPQTLFLLYVNDIPVGLGKIRHCLTDESRRQGGNLGYAISSERSRKVECNLQE